VAAAGRVYEPTANPTANPIRSLSAYLRDAKNVSHDERETRCKTEWARPKVSHLEWCVSLIKAARMDGFVLCQGRNTLSAILQGDSWHRDSEVEMKPFRASAGRTRGRFLEAVHAVHLLHRRRMLLARRPVGVLY
jgi:hypothetical protein